MIINGFSSSSIASSVWAAVSRTLTNPSGIWSEATRNLSAIGAAYGTSSHVAQTVISGGTQVDLRPAAGKYRELTVGGTGSSTSGLLLILWDGTNLVTVASSVAAGQVGSYMSGDSVVGPLVKLNGANPGNYMAFIQDWTQ